MIRELTSLGEFRQADSRRESIVITDATGNIFHQAPWSCDHVTEENFVAKVLINKGRNGRYFAVGTFAEAQNRWPGLTRCW
jgi:hypothetical protein